MSTPPNQNTSYPQEPTPLPVPSNAPLSYGDLVTIVNQYAIWFAAPTSPYGGGTNPQANLTQTTSQSAAQTFMIVSSNGTVPVGSSGFPNVVNYNDTVAFVAYPSYTGLVGFAPVLSGQSKLVLQQGYLSNNHSWWQLQPTGSQSGPIMVPNGEGLGNQVYLRNVNNKHYYNNDSSDSYWSQSAHNGDIYELQFINPICGQIADCPTGGTGYACWTNKCYPNQTPPYSADAGNANFMSNVFNQICTPAPDNTNNLEQAFCFSTCNGFSPTANSTSAAQRGQCDTNYNAYCSQVWGAPPNAIIPGSPHVCSCIQAANSNIPWAQCYWPFCANRAYNSYLTSGQASALASPGCQANCVNIFNCTATDSSQCNIAQNTFDQACGGQSGKSCTGAGSTCQPGLSCVNGTCQTGGTSGTCPTTPCPAGQVCNANGSCVLPGGSCSGNSDCASPQVCSNGNCITQTPCNQNSDCPTPNLVCYQNVCIQPQCTSTADCNAPAYCDTSTYTCVTACQQTTDCQGNMVCQNGICVNPPPPTTPNPILAFIKENWKWFALGGGSLLLLIVILVAISKATKKKPTSKA